MKVDMSAAAAAAVTQGWRRVADFGANLQCPAGRRLPRCSLGSGANYNSILHQPKVLAIGFCLLRA